MKRDDWLHEKITLVSDLALTIKILKKAHEDAQLMVSRLDGTIKVAEQNLERVKAAFQAERSA